MKNLLRYAFLILIITSCEETDLPGDETQSSEVSMEVLSMDNLLNILDTFSETALENSQFKGDLGYEISVSGTSFPMTTTIDFGEGYSPYENVIFKGIIQIVSSDYFYMPESIQTMTFDNFLMNEALLEGTRTMTNQGYTEDSQYPTYRIVFEQGKITKSDDSPLEFTKEYNRTRIDEASWRLNTDSQWAKDEVSLKLSSQEPLFFNKVKQEVIMGVMKITFNDSLIMYWDFETKEFSLAL